MAIYLGDEKNLARKILKFYIGDENGVARKVTKAYIGDANGVARLFYTAHTHAYISNNDYTFDATISTSQHYYTESCECGDTITKWEDHEFQYYYQAPTCSEDGFEEETCICGYGGYRDLPAYGHTEVTFDALEPTCVQGGNTEGIQCSECGEWLVRPEPLDPLGHAPQTLYGVEPTCTDPGLTDGIICGRCYEILDPPGDLPALGHDWELTDSATMNNGYNRYECANCGDTYSEYVGLSGGEEDTSTTTW